MRTLAAVLVVAAAAACSPGPSAVRTDPRLDALFDQLRASDALSAARVEKEIWTVWSESGSPTIDILMERAAIAQASGRADLARQYLDEATRLAPDYAEAWNRRAILAFDAEDYAGAIADIQETLKREPRHFGALAGLGAIYEAMGKPKAALEAYRAALEVHPTLESAKEGEARLGPQADGDEA